jgi:hypothetical protein
MVGRNDLAYLINTDYYSWCHCFAARRKVDHRVLTEIRD